MKREALSDLAVFLAVAEARSFTKAAATLGTSQSAMSQIVRRLEAAVGLKLLTRNTRNVAPTEAGEQLITTLRPPSTTSTRVSPRSARCANVPPGRSGLRRAVTPPRRSCGRRSAG